MDRSRKGLGSSAAGAILLGLVYFCCAILALRLTDGVDGIATVWPPSGILLATLLAVPRRSAWRYALSASVASWIANYIVNRDLLLATGFTCANLVEALTATFLLRGRSGCRVAFVDPQGLGRFAWATLLAATISAGIAFLVDPQSDRNFLVSWFATVWLGMLLVTPALMVLYETFASIRKVVPAVEVWTLLQIAAVAAAVCSVTFLQSSYPLLFLPMMVAVAAVLRGGALGGIVVIATAAALGTWSLAHGYGPVSLIHSSREVQVLFFQVYLVTLFLSALPMARLLAGDQRLRIDLAERVRLLDEAEKAGHIGHWRVSPVDKTIYWSPEVFRIHGVAEGDPPAIADAIDFYHPADRSEVAAAINRALNEGRPFEFSARVVRPDGVIRHVVSRGERDYSSKDGAIGLFGIIQDITEQVEASERLAEARDAAERSAKEALALADTDALTKIANRRCISRRLSESCSDAREDEGDLSLVLVDVDHFKSINDRFGHDVGDEVLKRVARAAAAELRSTDLIGRYGGEEFILLLPKTNAPAALRIAERVRTAIENGDENGGPNVTISLGVATRMADEDARAILKRADVALYAAKRAGRNQVCLAP